jgi:peptide/nickel transport system permease protein
MLHFLIRRLLIMIPVAWGVVSLTFLMVHLIPGDPVDAIQSEGNLTVVVPVEQAQALRHDLGLDKPIGVQYIDYMANAVRLDFGNSIRTHLPVSDEIRTRMPTTIKLAGLVLFFSILFGLIGGILSAVRNRKPLGTGLTVGSLLAISIPDYWLGVMLALVFGVYLAWLPVAGAGGISHLILPAVTLAIGNAALLTRLTRASLLSILGADFVRTARAKGVTESVVVSKHALRNALVPVITIIGLMVAGLLSGVVIIEKVFAIPGVGALAVDAVTNRDFPVVQGTAFFFALILMGVNLLVDISYAFLDPRIRYS